MEIPDELLHAFEAVGGAGVVAFVGSGPSCDAGIPDWPNLIRRVAVELALDEEITPYLATGRLLEAAEFLSRERSEGEIQQRIASEVRRFTTPGELHERIASAPFSAIVTTNYDLLLSKADRQRKFGDPLTPRTVNVRDHLNRAFMLHLHGHINEPDSIVLSRNGYDQIVAPERAPARQFLFSLFGNYSVLFIGYGFRDLDVDAILRDGEQLGALGHTTLFALVPSKRPQVDRVMQQNFKVRQINAIRVADDGDHGKSAAVSWLADLSRCVEKIATAHRNSARSQRSPELIAKIELLLRQDCWQRIPAAITQLRDRPDMDNLRRKGLTGAELPLLLDELSLEELRQVLVSINSERRNFILEDILSCIPPEG